MSFDSGTGGERSYGGAGLFRRVCHLIPAALAMGIAGPCGFAW